MTAIMLNSCEELFMFFFNLIPQIGVHDLFTSWLEEINRKLKSQIFVGASAICWVIWLTRNDIVFDKVVAPSYLQAIFMGTYWTRSGPCCRRKRIAI